MKKFELTTETKINICGKKLFRIKALISFGLIIAGEKGGWIEKEENLSQYGNAQFLTDSDIVNTSLSYRPAISVWLCYRHGICSFPYRDVIRVDYLFDSFITNVVWIVSHTAVIFQL